MLIRFWICKIRKMFSQCIPIATIPPCYIPPHMQNFEESNFQDFDYNHSLDHKEIQGGDFLWRGVPNKTRCTTWFIEHHVSKGANYKTQLSKLTKLIVICDDDNCAWRCRASYILASKQWEIRKLYEPYTCSNTSISHDHAKLSYLLISKSIHNLIKNDPSTSVSALIAHIKSTEGYTTTYRKAWLVKQKAIENIYDNWKYHTTIYQDFCKLCNNCFLAWSWRRKHC